jgi:hypothetical protein
MPLDGLAKPAADGIDGGGEAVTGQDRQGLVREVVVGIVEGQHQGPGRQGPLAPQTGQGALQVQHLVAQGMQEPHLPGEAPLVAVIGPMRPHGREVANLVVHEDGNAGRHIRKSRSGPGAQELAIEIPILRHDGTPRELRLDPGLTRLGQLLAQSVIPQHQPDPLG